MHLSLHVSRVFLVATWLQPLNNEGEWFWYLCERLCTTLQRLCIYFLVPTSCFWHNKPSVQEEIQVLHLPSNHHSHCPYECTVHPSNTKAQPCDGARPTHTTHTTLAIVVGCATAKYWRFQLDFHFSDMWGGGGCVVERLACEYVDGNRVKWQWNQSNRRYQTL